MKANKFVGCEQIAPLTFDTPTQVYFHGVNDDDCEGNGGIAYGDQVICACCGGIVPMDEIDLLIVYDTWVSFSEEIIDTEQLNEEAESDWDILYPEE